MHRSHASMYIHVYIIYISIYHAYPSMSILFFYFSYRQRRSKGQCYGSASQLYPSMSTKTSLNDSSAVCSATTYRSSSYLTMYMARERGRGRRLVIIGLTIGCDQHILLAPALCFICCFYYFVVFFCVSVYYYFFVGILLSSGLTSK